MIVIMSVNMCKHEFKHVCRRIKNMSVKICVNFCKHAFKHVNMFVTMRVNM